MRLVTFSRGVGAPEPGVLQGEKVVGLGALGYSSVQNIIENWSTARGKIESSLAGAASVDLSSVKLSAPLPKPNKIVCVGLNYRDHAIESGMKIPEVPTVFNKFNTAVIGPGDTIVLPKNSKKPDYEAEMVFVIGKGGRYIAADDWKAHVFGYMIGNDVSARDYQLEGTTQWLLGKTFDTFAPMGPALVTADEVADPHDLDVKMTIGDQVLQNSNTKHLIFNIPALISYLSSIFTLEAGDVVFSGTPAGVGLGWNPPRWLKPGDECVVSVSGLGELRNPCVAEG